MKPERVAKPDAVRVLMSRADDGRAISFFGDLHPSFAGNVVKAMGERQAGLSRGQPRARAPAPPAPAPEALVAKLERRAAPHRARWCG